MVRHLSRGTDMRSQPKFTLFLDYTTYLLVRFLEEALNVIPERWAFAAGRLVGRLAWVILPDRRHAALENLTIAFGKEQSPRWIMRTARKSFEHVGQVATEFFLLRRWSEEEMAKRIVLEGQLPYELAMMPGNEGILLLNSHFGCFEVSAATVKFLGMRTNLVMTGVKNPFLSRYLYTRAGENSGIKTFPHKGIVKEMIRRLRGGEMLACLSDQRGDAERGIFVDFFGTTAPANEVFARMAIEGEARILPLCTYRKNDGTYRSIFGEEIKLHLTGNTVQDLTTVSQQFHDQFEAWLRIDPEQGFWLQRKWRRKPSRRRSAPAPVTSAKDASSLENVRGSHALSGRG
jgi:Kdo2-lipid IVA lauroyltransferase/acyltransferase